MLRNGTPAANAVVTWIPATNAISAPTSASLSGSNGIVSQQLTIGALPAGAILAVNACLASGGGCAKFNVVSVPPADAQLQAIAGVAQSLPSGQPFAPVILEVTDPAGHPLAGANVIFYETLDAWTQPCSLRALCPPSPLLEQKTVEAASGPDGTVVLNPITGSAYPVRLSITAVTGDSAVLSFALEQYP